MSEEKVTLNVIYNELQTIKKDIRDINKRLDKLDKHINFVENVYNNVKSPLEYICNAVNSVGTRTVNFLQ